MRIAYSTETCGRCGGSGWFGPSSVDGGRCFGCVGFGVKIDANGRRAQKRVEQYRADHMTVAASSLQPGNRVMIRHRTRAVESVETTLGCGRLTSREGVAGTESYVEYMQLGTSHIKVTAGEGAGVVCAAHAPIALAWSRDHVESAARLVASMRGAIITW